MLIGVFLKKSLMREREKLEHPPLFNMGNCGLHLIHRTFETDIQANAQELDKIMKSMYKLFDKSPAKRNIYVIYDIVFYAILRNCSIYFSCRS